MTPLMEGATQMHELFLCYQKSGFTEQQSLYLVGQVLKAMFTQPGAS